LSQQGDDITSEVALNSPGRYAYVLNITVQYLDRSTPAARSANVQLTDAFTKQLRSRARFGGFDAKVTPLTLHDEGAPRNEK